MPLRGRNATCPPAEGAALLGVKEEGLRWSSAAPLAHSGRKMMSFMCYWSQNENHESWRKHYTQIMNIRWKIWNRIGSFKTKQNGREVQSRALGHPATWVRVLPSTLFSRVLGQSPPAFIDLVCHFQNGDVSRVFIRVKETYSYKPLWTSLGKRWVFSGSELSTSAALIWCFIN